MSKHRNCQLLFSSWTVIFLVISWEGRLPDHGPGYRPRNSHVPLWLWLRPCLAWEESCLLEPGAIVLLILVPLWTLKQPCNLASAPFSCGSGPVLPMQGPVQKTQQEPQPSMHQYQGCCLKTQLRTQQQPGDPFSTLFDCEPRGNPISPGAWQEVFTC